MNLEALAQRIQVLEDTEAIKKLKARYCAYCDDGDVTDVDFMVSHRYPKLIAIHQ